MTEAFTISNLAAVASALEDRGGPVVPGEAIEAVLDYTELGLDAEMAEGLAWIRIHNGGWTLFDMGEGSRIHTIWPAGEAWRQLAAEAEDGALVNTGNGNDGH